MLSDTKRQVINLKIAAFGWLICLNSMMKHGPAKVKITKLSNATNERPFSTEFSKSQYIKMTSLVP
jgi:hypothetical protein